MEDSTPSEPCCGCGQAPPERSLRGFFGAAAAIVLGGLALLTPVAVAVAAVLHPLRRKGRDGKTQGGNWLRITSLETLPDDGTPRKFPVVAARRDAWNFFPHEPVGAVFLRRRGDKVEALNVVCPHNGCFVGYQAPKNILFCPCHRAGFGLDGKRLQENSPSPRDLDTLRVEIRNGTEVWVDFQNFRTGTSEKIAEA